MKLILPRLLDFQNFILLNSENLFSETCRFQNSEDLVALKEYARKLLKMELDTDFSISLSHFTSLAVSKFTSSKENYSDRSVVYKSLC